MKDFPFAIEGELQLLNDTSWIEPRFDDSRMHPS